MVSLYFLEVGINGTYFGTVAKNIFVFIKLYLGPFFVSKVNFGSNKHVKE